MQIPILLMSISRDKYFCCNVSSLDFNCQRWFPPYQGRKPEYKFWVNNNSRSPLVYLIIVCKLKIEHMLWFPACRLSNFTKCLVICNDSAINFDKYLFWIVSSRQVVPRLWIVIEYITRAPTIGMRCLPSMENTSLRRG